MKRPFFASALCLLAPIMAHADCAATDFVIQGFQVTVVPGGLRPRMSMKGELVNHCAQAAAAQLEVSAKDASGGVITAKKAWPAGTTNIEPGKSVTFDVGSQFHYDPSMQTYSAGIASVRSW